MDLISPKVIKITITSFVVVLSGVLGYLIGCNTLSTAKNSRVTVNTTPVPTSQQPSSVSIPSPKTVTDNKWGEYTQEFMSGYTFDIYYPLDNQHKPFISYSQDPGWPISTIERLFKPNVSFGYYQIGVSDADPTSCYKDTCQNVLDSIVKEEPATIDGIASRKITAKISHKGGGIILPGEINDSVFYVIPYKNKFIIILDFYPDTNFEKFVKSFQVKPNDVPFKKINPDEL